MSHCDSSRLMLLDFMKRNGLIQKYIVGQHCSAAAEILFKVKLKQFRLSYIQKS